MFRTLHAAAGFGILSSALLSAATPAAAYDPCARATERMIAARTAFDNYCNNNPQKCRNSSPRYGMLLSAYINSYERMRVACRQ